MANPTDMTLTIRKRRLLFSGLVISLLLIPAIGNLVSDEVNWSLTDFVIGFFLPVGTGFSVDLILTKVKSRRNRLFLVLGILFLLVTVWAELAVGVFGTPFAGS